MNTVEQQILRYEEAIDSLEQASNAQVSSASLRALIARDRVALALSEDSHDATPEMLKLLTRTDRRLTDLAVKVDSNVGRETLGNWRRSVNPDESFWWWKLDDLAAAKQTWGKRISTFLAVLLVTISIGLAADTFNLLRSLGANPVSTIGTLIQAALAFIAASAFTEAGRKWLVERFSHPLFGKRKFKGWARTGLAFVILLLTAVIWFFLPQVAARYFRHQGEKFLNAGLTQQAMIAYQQAVTLEPLVIKTHLDLANAEEKTADYGKAIEEYKSTIALSERIGQNALDDSYYLAKIKLARLLILQQNYRNALLVLNDVQEKIQQVSLANRKLQLYFVLTYSGWADLELKHHDQARSELNAAIGQHETGAAAHYLLGVTLEELKDAKAKDEWTRFIQILQQDPSQIDEVQPDWTSYAQEKLTKGT